MADIAYRCRVKGMVKFQMDDIWGESPEDVREKLKDNKFLLREIAAHPADDDDMEFTISEIEDMGLEDMDKFYGEGG